MNRQVFPSMILSVLIVCFFSIMLYEREKPEATARSAIGPDSASTSPSPGVDKPVEPTAPVPKSPDARSRWKRIRKETSRGQRSRRPHLRVLPIRRPRVVSSSTRRRPNRLLPPHLLPPPRLRRPQKALIPLLVRW